MSRLHFRTLTISSLLMGAGIFGQGCIIQPGPAQSGNNGTSSSAVSSATAMTTTGSTGMPSTQGTGSVSVGDSTNDVGSSLPSSGTQSSGLQSSGTTDSTDAGSGTNPAPPEDPYLWLEEVQSDRSMNWVKGQNAQTAKTIEADPGFARTQTKIKAMLDAEGGIPHIQKIGFEVFNFWRDKTHPVGIWRKSNLRRYRSKQPRWTTVLDLDKLAKDEGKNWVWKGATCRRDSTQCMLALSDGGKDAIVLREFDTRRGRFVDNGFTLPESVGRVSWLDRDTLLVGSNFGPGTTTQSGYPRQIRKWKRGTKIGDAKVIYEGKETDSVVRAYHMENKGNKRTYLLRHVSRHQQEHYLVNADDTLVKLDVPSNSRLLFWGEWLVLDLKEDWAVDDSTWVKGSVVAVNLKDFLDGKRDITALFTPTKNRSFQRITATRDHLLLTEMEDVKGRLREWSYNRRDGWKGRDVKVPDSGSFNVTSYDSNRSNFYALTYSDFLTPSTLYWKESGSDLNQELYALPKAFDASGFEVVQHFATSKDGTKIPYFQVSKKGLTLDKSNPTLLYGYGGFQITQKPQYNPMVATAWLDNGGVYVLANIRGGGEYGPAWHQAALRENRPRAYEDFSAVGQDLIDRGVTQPKHLGIYGRSNGGLLTGVMLTRYPNLWGAVISEVPLLDMKRFHKLLAGALWRGEYGDPDVAADWDFLSKYSPYQNIQKGQTLPPALFATSTKDDRVHPAHARKMVARLQEFGYSNASLYENTEGGHGGASNSEERAYLEALKYSFLGQNLGLELK